MRTELQEKLNKVKDSTSALMLLADIEDPVLKHEDGGPSMMEWAEFNRMAHGVIHNYLGGPQARQALLLMQKKEQESFAECWSCRVLDHYLPEHGDPDPRWVGVA